MDLPESGILPGCHKGQEYRAGSECGRRRCLLIAQQVSLSPGPARRASFCSSAVLLCTSAVDEIESRAPRLGALTALQHLLIALDVLPDLGQLHGDLSRGVWSTRHLQAMIPIWWMQAS